MRLSKFIRKKLAGVKLQIREEGTRDEECDAPWTACGKKTFTWDCFTIELWGNGSVYEFPWSQGQGCAWPEDTPEFRESFFGSILMDANYPEIYGVDGFQEWAMDMGGNPDSIKEYETWKKILDINKKLAKIIGADKLQEAFECENDI